MWYHSEFVPFSDTMDPFWPMDYIALHLASCRMTSQLPITPRALVRDPDKQIDSWLTDELVRANRILLKTDEFKAKVFLYPFPRCFQKLQILLTILKKLFFPLRDLSQRNVTAANPKFQPLPSPSPPPPPQPNSKRTIDVVLLHEIAQRSKHSDKKNC